MVKRNPISYFLLLFVLSLNGCGNENAHYKDADTGSVAFGIAWQTATAGSQDSGVQHSKIMAAASIDCAAIGVSTVSAIVHDSFNNSIASGGPWNCSDHTGTVSTIPAGSNRKFAVLGKDSAGNVLYRGEQAGVTITSGQTTNVGTITATVFTPSLVSPSDASTVSASSLSFAWTGSGASYQLQVSNSSNFGTTSIDTTISSTTYTPSSLTAGTYYWRVSARDISGNTSNWSSMWSLTVSGSGGTTPGISWTVRGSGTTNDLYGVAWAGTQFVAVGANGTILTSPDGIAWTKRTTTVAYLLTSVVWSGTQFVAVGGEGGEFTSPDGITWTHQMNLRNHSDLIRDVTWFGNRFIAVGRLGGGEHIYTSTDGITWTTDYTSYSVHLRGVTTPGNKFAAVGGTDIVTSPDGVNWTVLASGTTNWLYGVTWSGSQFVATGENGTILTSSDGVTWTSRTSGTSNKLNSVSWSGSLFVTAGSGGTILTSPDGITWTSRTSGTSNNINSVAWSGTRFVAVGEWGTILTSP